MNHIDQLVAKIIDDAIEISSLSAHQQNLVILKFQEIANSLMDTKLEDLGLKLLDTIRPVISPAYESIDRWYDDINSVESFEIAEKNGSVYLPPDDYMLQ